MPEACVRQRHLSCGLKEREVRQDPGGRKVPRKGNSRYRSPEAGNSEMGFAGNRKHLLPGTAPRKPNSLL